MSDLPPPDPPEPDGESLLTRRRLLAVAGVAVVLVGLLAATGVLSTGSDDGTDSGREGRLAIADVEASAEVTAGERATVQVTVENSGDGVISDTVSVALDGLGTESVEVTVPGGETETTTVEFETGEGDAGEYTAAVTTSGESAETTATVVPAEPNFEIANLDTPPEVKSGGNLTVGYTVENTGGDGGTQTLVFSIDGVSTAGEQYTLSSGETATGTLSYEVSESGGSTVTAEVASEDDSARTTVVVTEAAGLLTVTGLEAPNVTVGDTLEITVGIENVGGGSESQTVEVDAGVLGSESTQIERQAGESARETFTFDTSDVMPGEYTIEASTDDDTRTTTVGIGDASPDPPESSFTNLDIAGQGTTATVSAGTDEPVAVEVTNVGEEPGGFDLTLTVGNETVTRTTDSIAANDSTAVVLDGVLSDLNPGNYSVTVETDDDSATGRLTVNEAEQAVFEIRSTDAQPERLEPGGTATLSATIENVGASEGTVSVGLDVIDAGLSRSTELTLTSGATETVTFDAIIDETGSYPYLFSIGDAEEGGVVSVQEGPSFDVSITGTNAPVEEGETLEVTATVENTGGTGSQDISLNVPSLGSSTRQVRLNSGATEQVTLRVQTESGDSGEYTATVASNTAQDSVLVAVGGDPNLQLRSIDAPPEVPASGTLEVGYTIENIGGGTGTEGIVALRIADVGFADSDTDVRVESGQQVRGTLTFSDVGVLFDPGDTIEFTVELQDFEDTASGSTTVTNGTATQVPDSSGFVQFVLDTGEVRITSNT